MLDTYFVEDIDAASIVLNRTYLYCAVVAVDLFMSLLYTWYQVYWYVQGRGVLACRGEPCAKRQEVLCDSLRRVGDSLSKLAGTCTVRWCNLLLLMASVELTYFICTRHGSK